MHTPIAIIGCGMAGLSAASQLSEAGLPVQIFEKNRSSGGRLASLHTEHGDFDLGAQCFTVRDRAFRQAVQHWVEHGCLQLWTASLHQLDEDGVLLPSPDAQERFIGVPRMSALTRDMLGELPLSLDCRIRALEQDEDGASWWLQDVAGQRHGPFCAVILAVPPAQASSLLADMPQLARSAASVAMEPVWAAAFVFEQALQTAVDGCFVRRGPLDWLARNSGKPGRGDNPDLWVVHASSSWSQQHLDEDPAGVAELLRCALAETLGCTVPEARYSTARRWRHARTLHGQHSGALADTRLGLYLCGDWCHGGRVEGAWLSGRDAARRLIGQLPASD